MTGAPATGCQMTDRMLVMADEAWFELLKDKMKADLQKSCGDKLTKLAGFVTAANNERWSAMINGKAQCERFKSELAAMMIEGASKK